MITIKEEEEATSICVEPMEEKNKKDSSLLYLDIPIHHSHEVGNFPPGCRVLYSIKKEGKWSTNFATVEAIAINIQTRENAYKINDSVISPDSLYHTESALAYAPETTVWLAIPSDEKYIPAIILSALPLFAAQKKTDINSSDQEVKEKFSTAYSVISLRNHSVSHGIQDSFLKFRAPGSDPPMFPRSLELMQKRLLKKNSETNNNDHQTKREICEDIPMVLSSCDMSQRVPPKKRKRNSIASFQLPPTQDTAPLPKTVEKVENNDIENEKKENLPYLEDIHGSSKDEHASTTPSWKKHQTLAEEETRVERYQLEGHSDDTLNVNFTQYKTKPNNSAQDRTDQQVSNSFDQKKPQSSRQISGNPTFAKNAYSKEGYQYRPPLTHSMISKFLFVPKWANLRYIKERVLSEREELRKRYNCCSISVCNTLMTGHGMAPRVKVTGENDGVAAAICYIQTIVANSVKPDDRCLMVYDLSFANADGGGVVNGEFVYNFVPPSYTKRKWIGIIHIADEKLANVYSWLLAHNGERIKKFLQGSGSTVLLMKNSSKPHLIASSWQFEMVQVVADRIRALIDSL